MSEDKKLVILKPPPVQDAGVEEMLVDSQLTIDDHSKNGGKFTHGITILFDDESRELRILATANLMKNTRDLIGMLEEVKLFLFRSNYE